MGNHVLALDLGPSSLQGALAGDKVLIGSPGTFLVCCMRPHVYLLRKFAVTTTHRRLIGTLVSCLGLSGPSAPVHLVGYMPDNTLSGTFVCKHDSHGLIVLALIMLVLMNLEFFSSSEPYGLLD